MTARINSFQPGVGCAPVRVANDDRHTLDLALLKVVRALLDDGARKLTFGQIYMSLIRARPCIPPITQCVVAVDKLVNEGLLVSERMLDEDPAFPFTQHIISGLTEVAIASLQSKEDQQITMLPADGQ